MFIWPQVTIVLSQKAPRLESRELGKSLCRVRFKVIAAKRWGRGYWLWALHHCAAYLDSPCDTQTTFTVSLGVCRWVVQGLLAAFGFSLGVLERVATVTINKGMVLNILITFFLKLLCCQELYCLNYHPEASVCIITGWRGEELLAMPRAISLLIDAGKLQRGRKGPVLKTSICTLSASRAHDVSPTILTVLSLKEGSVSDRVVRFC